MAEYLIQDTTLTAIAEAIRSKTQDTANILTEDMAEQIESISVETYSIEVTVDSGATVTATNFGLWQLMEIVYLLLTV